MQDHTHKRIAPVPEFWHVVLYPAPVKSIKEMMGRQEEDKIIHEAFNDLGFVIKHQRIKHGKRDMIVMNKKKSAMTFFILKCNDFLNIRMAEINTFYHNTKGNLEFLNET